MSSLHDNTCSVPKIKRTRPLSDLPLAYTIKGLSGTGYWCALGQAVTIATIACSLKLEKRDMAHNLHEDAQPIKVYYVKLRLECRGLSTMPKLSYNRSQLHP